MVMKFTDSDYTPVVYILHNSDVYIFTVNAMLIRNYGNSTIRRRKTDKQIPRITRSKIGTAV